MADNFQSRQERRKQLEQNKKRNKNKKPNKSIFKRILFFLMIFAVIGVVAGGATFAYYVSTTPKIDESLLKDPISSKIYDEKGELLAEVGAENRDYVAYEDIPELVRDAVIATEDSRFFEHNGVDVLRLGSAVLANFTDGFGSQGGSTITQQLVKRSFLSPDKTLKRKSQELWLSLQIEQKYSKEEIFEMYVNKIYYGSGAYGIATAAETYFGKSLDELNLTEAATLAGLPQSPSAYDPFNHPEKAEKRRNIVLQLMNKHGYISESEMKEAQGIKIADTLLSDEERQSKDTTPYDSFVDVVIEEVEDKTDYNVFTDGLEIYTTIDKEAQEYVYKMLNSNDIIDFGDSDMQAGITLLDTTTGQIKAIGGGRNQTVQRGLNYATQIKRQPGSTAKPILDYGPAIEYLKWSTYEQVVDEEHAYSDGTPIRNYNGNYHGQMSIRQALAKSYNIPALKAMQAVGLDKSKEFGEKLGFDFSKGFFESYAIGGWDPGVSSLDLAGAYSAFGNEGIYNEPYAVTKIVLADDTEEKFTSEPVVAMKESTAFMVTDMLKSVMTSGTGTTANVSGLPVAGKSGTTNYTDDERDKYNISRSPVPDAWFVGYTTNYTAAIWTGGENRKDYLDKTEQKYAQRMFKALMSEVSEGKKTKDFKKPSSVVKVGVEKGSDPAALPSANTPSDQIVYEYFVKGTEPTKVSETYDSLEAPNVGVEYDEAAQQLKVSWSYPDMEGESVSFKVLQNIDNGGYQTLQTTTEKEVAIPNPTPGSIYQFSVTALVGDRESEPGTVSIQIPGEEEEIPEVPADDAEEGTGEDDGQNGEEQSEETPDQDDSEDAGDNGSENGNGNGNGSGNGSGNGNNNGNGNGNGSGGEGGNTGSGSGTGTSSSSGTISGSGSVSSSSTGIPTVLQSILFSRLFPFMF